MNFLKRLFGSDSTDPNYRPARAQTLPALCSAKWIAIGLATMIGWTTTACGSQGYSVDALRKAAAQGSAPAEYRLGLMYDEGWEEPLDHAMAIRWWRKAAEQGYAKAQIELGDVYLLGKVVPQDYAEAVRWFRKAAEQGDGGAQSNLGWMYEKGQGVPQDYVEAGRWYRKAAEQGDSSGQRRLGTICATGEGIPPNPNEAVRWFRKAAEQGDADGQAWLGVMYYTGQGVPQDYLEAYMWLSLAHSRGGGEQQTIAKTRDGAAKKMTAGQIQEAQRRVREWKPTIDQNTKKSVDLVRKAAEQGDATAQFELGTIYDSNNGYGVSQDHAEAALWYRRAAEKGNTYAQLDLGDAYENGNGVTQDYAEAARWYRKAAEQGSARAQAKLGFLYEGGKGVTKDVGEAARWFCKAAEQGDPGGQVACGADYFEGDGVPRDYLKGYIWLTLGLSHDDGKRVREVRSSYATSRAMSAEQIAEAERQAQEWKPTGEGSLFSSLSARSLQQKKPDNGKLTKEDGIPNNQGRLIIQRPNSEESCMTTVCDPSCRMVSVPCSH